MCRVRQCAVRKCGHRAIATCVKASEGTGHCLGQLGRSALRGGCLGGL
jgi:hypothetical protein